MTIQALIDALNGQGHRDVIDTSTLTRALHTSDASLYRIEPQAVATPRSTDELIAVATTAIELGVPITPRGAGTSCAGNAVGPGLIIDTRRHLQRIHHIDPEARTAIIDPGVIQATLTAAGQEHGLRFGPDPSTFTRCTVGGMIGNNACGPRALGYGRSADNVVRLKVVTGTGELVDTAAPPTSLTEPLHELVNSNLGLIRTEFGRFTRQVSGYSMEHLLPENGFALGRFLSGTEGTLGVIAEAEVRLVADAPIRNVLALGYATMPEAADAITRILPFRPTAAEGLDRRIVDVVIRAKGASAVPDLPRGDGWMFVELVGEDAEEVAERSRALLEAATPLDGWIVEDAAEAARLWQIRADGAGLAGVSLARPAHGGWEDAAVPPERLGEYLRAFDALLTEHGLEGLPYGHFGDGCVHCRIDFPLDLPDGPAAYRRFVTEAAELVAGFGGSMSGEHGDGRARSELLETMYSPEALALMRGVKHIFDPHGVMNPGVLVDPDPLDASMRVPQTRGSLLARTNPEFVEAVHQCTGVGKCIADNSSSGGVMCPSYRATGEEKDSTRGRARVLQEMVNGSLLTGRRAGGWDSPEVHEALDLCLSCKGCYSDCPTGIDIASYKSIVLDESYRGRLRPRSHYAMGWLPRWGRTLAKLKLGELVNRIADAPGLGALVKWSAEVDQRRTLPKFAVGSNKTRAQVPATSGTPVAIWVDSFSDCFEFSGLEPMVKVLIAAGFAPRIIDKKACCGLTWISTGQRDGARNQLRQALDVLHPYVEAGIPVVGVEPSCTAVWRTDALELLPDDPRVPEVAENVLTLAEILTRSEDYRVPDLTGLKVVAQPHCHHASVLGWATDRRLLEKAGVELTTVAGCCGLAGNFGVEKGHHEVSVAVAENDLLPAVRAAGPDAVVLADGFSCRFQLEQLEGRRAVTLAELLTGSNC